MGVSFLFEVDWLSGLGVIGIFFSFNQDKNLWGTPFSLKSIG